jgi:hypothetical protein
MTSTQEHISSAGRERSRSKVRPFAAVTAVAIATMLTAPPLFAERLSDADVRALFERLDWERDRFEDQLDGKIKRSILRGPGAEVNVQRFLDDLQENIDKLKERFTADYAASAEVTTLIAQATAIQRFMAVQPPNLDGASEWNRFSQTLKYIATVYGTAMPIPEGQQARRMNDREVERAADQLAEHADLLKKDLSASLKVVPTNDLATRDDAITNADALKIEAEILADTVGDGKPASGELQAVLARARVLRAAAAAYAGAPAAKRAWEMIEADLDTLGQAFEIPVRP